MSRIWERISHWVILAIFVFSLYILYRELSHYDLRDVSRQVGNISGWRLAAAVGLMVLNYVVLIGYDLVALKAIEHPLPMSRTAFGSFTGFVMSYNLGPLLGGTAVRFRLYSAWGLSAIEIIQLIGMLGITFWVGGFCLAGAVFLGLPPESLSIAPISVGAIRVTGGVLLLLTVGYVALTHWRRTPIRVMGHEIALPSSRYTLLQMAIAALDFAIAAGCLHVLVAQYTDLTYWQTLTMMLVAMVLGSLSHVPGGVGIFELVLLELSGPNDRSQLMACLLAFRLVYYLLPLGVAMLMLAVNECLAKRATLSKWTVEVAKWSSAVAPRFLAAVTFLSGVVLLFSAATPLRPSRALFLEDVVPLPIVEISHFLGSIIGASLLIIAAGLNRRLDSAWWLAISLALAGMVTVVLKGLDFEEAAFLGGLACLLLLYRKSFYRRGQLVNQRYSREWFGAVVLAVICFGWLALFANKHVHFTRQLWWQFSLDGDASRALRASVGVMCILLLFAIRKLVVPRRSAPKMFSPATLTTAADIAAKSTESYAALARLGDKQFLFNADETGFVMYSTQGRTWVSMRDPIGPRKCLSDLVWSFRSLVDEHDGWPAFYQVHEKNLSIYLDQGMTLLKLGEEARVPLVDFTMDGPIRRGLRQTVSRLQRERCVFEVVAQENVSEILPELRAISDAWLTDKRAHEKAFSLGYFQPEYVASSPCGIIRRDGEIIAFTNLWCSDEREEMAADLMRYRPDAPASTMEYLLIESILYAKQQDYHWFNLGMAPLSGIPTGPLAPLWNRAAGAVFRHGDNLYHFEGLRKYKEKFSPVWSPKYLASPGGFALPRILADIALLIARKPRPISARPGSRTDSGTPVTASRSAHHDDAPEAGPESALSCTAERS